MSDELFSREEILGGLHGSQAKRLLFWIETHTAYMVFRARRAIRQFLGQEVVYDAAPELLKDLGLSIQSRAKVTLDELERYAPHWQSLVPDNPKARAALIRLFGRKYKMRSDAVPRIRAALGMDTAEVQDAYQTLHRKPLETLYRQPGKKITPQPETLEAPDETVNPEEIETELDWIHLSHGAQLFQQGDVGDSFYIVINGRLRAVTRRRDGETSVDLGHNEIIGEAALIAETAYASSVYAIRDSDLLKFSRQSLNRLAQNHPAFTLHLMQRMAAELYAEARQTPTSSAPRAVAIFPANTDVPLSDFIHRLATSLGKITKVLHLTPEVLDEALGAGLAQTPQRGTDNSRIAGWLSQQEGKYDLLLYQAEAELSAWTKRCIRQADRVLIVGNANDNPKPGQVETEILSGGNPYTKPPQELALLHPNRSRPPTGTRRWLEARPVTRHYHIAQDTEADFDRLARFLTGKAIGIVFGGGFTRGFAHGGVIKALEEVELRPDFVGGTSIGAAIGGLYALEWSYQKLMDRGRGFVSEGRKYIDLTLPLVSLISSRKLNKLTQELFGDTRIEDMWTNFFCVSSNLTRGRMMIHQRGPLWRAIRASYSLPTIMPPVPMDGDILVDGALFSNLPADTMREMVEGGPTLVINVSPKEEHLQRYNFDEGISAMQLLWSRFSPFQEELKAPSLISAITRSIVVGRDETWPEAARDIDLYLEPPPVEFDFNDAKSLDAMIEASYQAAIGPVKAWKQKIRMKDKG